jgi:hypothetical protein
VSSRARRGSGCLPASVAGGGASIGTSRGAHPRPNRLIAADIRAVLRRAVPVLASVMIKPSRRVQPHNEIVGAMLLRFRWRNHEWRYRVEPRGSIPAPGTAAIVKGFGCRPVVTYPVLRAGVRKPPRKEPAGAWRAVCGLWGFGRAGASASDELACVVDRGLASTIENWSPLLHSTE